MCAECLLRRLLDTSCKNLDAGSEFWTLSGKHWTVRPRITDKSPKVKMQRVTESRIKRIEMSHNRKLRRNTVSFIINSK